MNGFETSIWILHFRKDKGHCQVIKRAKELLSPDVRGPSWGPGRMMARRMSLRDSWGISHNVGPLFDSVQLVYNYNN